MHHQDYSGDPPVTGARKSTSHFRRGSGTSASSAGASGVTAEDTSAQAGSSSPASHHQSQAPGTQIKKKSGFQITSVTSAQISVSGNNSLADDTESYDDMDESHTEDLSSSDILDVSVPRATDTGVPGRSSSDETLNSLHGVDTPGLVSPNEHVHTHMAHTSMVNGTINPHFYPLPPQHPEGIPGGDPTLPSLPIAPLASSSPTIVSKVGTSQSQRAPVLDNTKPSGGIQPSVSDAHLHNSGNTSVSTAPVLPLSVSAGLDTHIGSDTGASASHTHSQPPQTQTTTGSRFRVVKLDTNSEPFRKGRWTCTEFYEKEVPQSAAPEAPKGLEVSETEPASHTLQSFLPNQDFSSPPGVQSPPQGLAHTAPLSYVPVHEGNMGGHLQKTVTAGAPAAISQPSNILPQQLPYAMDPLHPQATYPAQLHTGIAQGTVRQPDFIQPTAPFQTQVQPPLPQMSAGVPIATAAVPAQPPASITQQLPVQPPVSITQQLPVQPPVGIPQQLGALSHVAPPPQAILSTPRMPAQPQPPVLPVTLPVQPVPLPVQPVPLPVQPVPLPVQPAALPVPGALPHGAMPLTALQADLQPLLAPTAGLGPSTAAGRSSHLEDAHRLLFQHQGLLALPRLGVPGVAGAEGMVEGVGSGAVLGHMGMSAEASALMAAAAGLRSQPTDGEDDR